MLIMQKDGQNMNFCIWMLQNGAVYEGCYTKNKYDGYGRYMKVGNGYLVVIQGTFMGKHVKSEGLVSIDDITITG